MRHPAVTTTLLALLLAGCTGPPQQVAVPVGCDEWSDLAPDAALPPGEDVTVVTGDGVPLHGTYWRDSAVRAAVLVHGLNEDRRAWEPLVGALRLHGLTVLTFDLRGHGESRTRGGQPYELRNFTSQDFLLMEQDVQNAVSLVRGRTDPEGREPACIELVGASIGANLALRTLAQDLEHVDGAALLSPGEEYRGLRTDDAIGRAADAPLFLAAARGDTYAAQSAQALAAQARRDTLALVEGEAHGTELLRAGDVQPRLVAWFRTHA